MFSSTIIFIFLSTLASTLNSPSSPHPAARGPLNLDKHTHHKSASPDRYDAHSSVSPHRDYSPDYNLKEPKRSRHPRQDPVSPRCHSGYPDHSLVAEGGRSRHADPYPEHLLPSKGKSGDRYQNYEPTETGRARASWEEETERVVRRKERPARPPPPQSPVERHGGERERKKDRQHREHRGRDVEWERHLGREQRRDRDHREGAREKEWERDRGQSWDRDRDRDRQRHKDRERMRTRSRDRGLDEERGYGRDWQRGGRGSWEENGDDGGRERRARGRHRVQSGPDDVFEELRNDEERQDDREHWDIREGESPIRKHFDTHLTEETGTTESPSLGSAGVFVLVCWSCFLLWTISGGGCV